MLAYLLAIVVQLQPACETYAPRLDGTQVTVCNGSVVAVTDVPRVIVLDIDGPTTLVLNTETGSEWTIDSARLPAGMEEGGYMLLGTGGAMRVQRDVTWVTLADVYDPSCCAEVK